MRCLLNDELICLRVHGKNPQVSGSQMGARAEYRPMSQMFPEIYFTNLYACYPARFNENLPFQVPAWVPIQQVSSGVSEDLPYR